MAKYCTECGYDNEDARQACVMCYSFLGDGEGTQACSHCGENNAPDARFCGHCGEQLDASAPPAARSKDLLDAVLSGMGGLVGAAADEDFGMVEDSSDFESFIGPAEPAEPAGAAEPAPAAPAGPSALVGDSEEELAPAAPMSDDLDLSSIAPPPPPPGVEAEEETAPPPPPPPAAESDEDLVAPPPPPPAAESDEDLVPPPPPAGAQGDQGTATAPEKPAEGAAKPPGSLDLDDEGDDDFDWELDFGDGGDEKK